MLIRMIETRRGSWDGFTVERYYAGEQYDVPAGLACDFVIKGWAESVRVHRVMPGRILTNPSTYSDQGEEL